MPGALCLMVNVATALIEFGSRLSACLHRCLCKRRDRMRHLQHRDELADFSHELRTPLSVLTTRLDAMRDGIRPLDAEQLTLLAGSVSELEDLVDQFHQLALTDSGRLACRRDRLAWDSLIQSCLEEYKPHLSRRNLSLFVELTPGIDILGDNKHLRQSLRYLLDNCARHSQAGGTIRVSLHASRGWATLTVADTGPGVSEAQRRLLFNRFYRTDASRNRDTGGRGLGLTLVRTLTETQGGRVHARHTPEGGLGIVIALPLAPSV